VPRHRTGGCLADQAIGVRWWGVAQQGAVAPCGAGSHVRGFYIDDRHVSVSGIDCYCKQA